MPTTIRRLFLALPFTLAFACDAPVDGFDDEDSLAPAPVVAGSLSDRESDAEPQAPDAPRPASSSLSAAPVDPARNQLEIPYDLEMTAVLCKAVKQSAQFSALLAQGAQKGVSSASVHSMTNELCKFYGAALAGKKTYWNGTLDALVAQGRLTTADRKVLVGGLTHPRATMAAWEPQTGFGLALQSAIDDNTPSEAQASTAGDVGTILGAMIGGLGGTPASVGLGAAIGRVVGEAANTIGNYMNDLPPEEPGEEEGGEAGGEAGGDEGGT